MRETNDSTSGIKVVLQIADGLNTGIAQLALLNAAVEKAVRLCDEVLSASSTLDLLWTWGVRCEDRAIFDALATKFMQIQPKAATTSN
ncbi:hypothetical protein F441_17766 [Phytophthora nicotianae CJ01A1]|uniref:Uncharacterized protein n=4 Tax=Phytophthora nicotianae TaxID=4792 RepID=W2R0E4_PHYN3|nr:hypothetical protein PPTG_04282 [Phytophthora nicotianae INRA-310]ETL29526.1 hypothetical protein L916_17310 [Phytophthora nicotianae]ETN18798.1 hypothetical protein PPTG_04282 [Phytophthora nicotianae INRA-310]ETO64646.1 hypothetical protein F444_17929 [Phytophthora nicotianae P1976]ETP05667.1 hypothetical protein F441_17766 [Phytophthora nicotianae CJ01A1]